ncbi:hypothetical protein MVES_001646 [Malassezia vespertilionis]|uniref:Uncharacterized protein n=1 Tax=Malassezia vespertilionis TaxID=2020962 RepID=A0A2N1JDA3_9BASI|nr:hypothetical protein MVES_001646 [Malassezia vespertilionis]
MGSCFSSLGGKNDNNKKLTRTDTNRGNELRRTTSSYQGSVADGMRYSDRPGNSNERLTASQVHKSKTLEDRIRQAERESRTTGV